MRAVDFSAVTLARCWREIKPRGREDLTPWIRHRRKHLLEAGLDEVLDLYLRASRYARTTPDRLLHQRGER